MQDEVIYSCKAPPEATKKEAAASFAVLTVLFAIAAVVLSRLPFAGVTALLLLLFFAAGIYSVMKRALFDVTYVLYQDRLVYLRRYGAIEKENEVFPTAEAEFYEDKIIFRGRSYPFHPDAVLKEALLK